MFFFFMPAVSSLCSLSPAMSWFLCLWIAVSCLVLCQATLYETIQQHHVPRPGRNAIQILGESRPQHLCSSLCQTCRVSAVIHATACFLCIHLSPAGFVLVYVVYTLSLDKHALYSTRVPPCRANHQSGLRCLSEDAV